jgi:hypothetical protein
MPITPYVSPAAFRAHPTYLDTDGLRVGDPNPADQTAQLAVTLLEASGWADNQCNQPLGAHTWTQRCRSRIDRAGNLRFHPDHTPLITVSTVGYGTTPTALTTIDGAGAWIEDGTNVVLPLGGGNTAWSGSLQFGVPMSGEVFVQSTYTAGFVATALGADSAASATTLTVADPTGIVPGGQYRIWEPGVEETVTVSPTWTPPAATVAPTPASVTLAVPTLFAHASGSDLSGMPSELRDAVIQYATAKLMRPDSTAEDEYPNTSLGSDTRRNDPRNGSGLIAEAARTLSSYGRVR